MTLRYGHFVMTYSLWTFRYEGQFVM
uniref:Uncharacterized protein n=1 Tax=Panagrolaimus sp. ES5 TaxID=591445 RepID=A0AC34FB60_9BILA